MPPKNNRKQNILQNITLDIINEKINEVDSQTISSSIISLIEQSMLKSKYSFSLLLDIFSGQSPAVMTAELQKSCSSLMNDNLSYARDSLKTINAPSGSVMPSSTLSNQVRDITESIAHISSSAYLLQHLPAEPKKIATVMDQVREIIEELYLRVKTDDDLAAHLNEELDNIDYTIMSVDAIKALEKKYFIELVNKLTGIF